MTAQGDPQPQIWRPLVLRGIPLHLVVPAGIALLSFALLASGGVASWLGGWLMTVGLPLAIGAFVADPRALTAPAAAWLGWIVVSRAAGDLPQTPIGVAVVLAALGAAAVWLAQRAVLPAVEGTELVPAHDPSALPDIDELLAQTPEPPEPDAAAEVDEALAGLLDEPIEETVDAPSQAGADDAVPVDDGADGSAAPGDAPLKAPTPAEAEPQAEVEDEGGHVVEFPALTEADLAEAAAAEATAEAQANRADHA